MGIQVEIRKSTGVEMQIKKRKGKLEKLVNVISIYIRD